MPYPNWWAARVKSPGLFKWMRTKVLSPSIQMIHGQLKNPPAGQTGSVTQAYRFNIKEFQTRKQVTDWLKEHKVSYMFIEAPAKEVKKMSELQELVTTGIVDKILTEWNPNHDDRGRFSSGGGGGGGSGKGEIPGKSLYGGAASENAAKAVLAQKAAGIDRRLLGDLGIKKDTKSAFDPNIPKGVRSWEVSARAKSGKYRVSTKIETAERGKKLVDVGVNKLAETQGYTTSQIRKSVVIQYKG